MFGHNPILIQTAHNHWDFGDMDRGNGSAQTYLINAVSQRVGLSQKRIREYEKGGFIQPSRDPRTNNRLFSDADIQIILRVKNLLHDHGFTLACLRYFLASAPCWIVYSCPDKQECPAYQKPHTPCHEVAKSTPSMADKRCCDCPVYINRNLERFALLERP